ncbi:hypothetical protein QOT17_018829 [Balamuthia mandrillaris]
MCYEEKGKIKRVRKFGGIGESVNNNGWFSNTETVSMKSRPIVAFIPDLDKQGFCSVVFFCVKQLQEVFLFRGERELLVKSALDVPIKGRFGYKQGVVNQSKGLEVTRFH